MTNIFGLIDISDIYDRYDTYPHNQILAMWAFGGSYTVAMLSLLLCLMLAYSLRPHHLNWETKIKSVCTPYFFFYMQYLVFTMADLGYQNVKMQMIAGLCIGGIIRLSYKKDQIEKKPMFLGKLSLLLVLHIIGIAILLNWFKFRSSYKLLFGLYLYFFLVYAGVGEILSVFPKIWNPIEAGIVDPNKINPAYK